MRHAKALTLMVLLFIIPSIVSDEIGTGYVKNPIFTPANGGTVKNPCVVYDQSGFESSDLTSTYKMWFATEDGVALAYSADGFAWTEYNYSQPLSGLHPTADLPYVIYDKDAFGGTNYYYRIWYWSGITDSIEAIRTAESIDGILWENDRPIQQHLSDPTFQLVTIQNMYDGYFNYNLGPGSILYNPQGTDSGSATPNDKSDDQPMTYRYIMYYNSSSEGSSPEGGGIQTSLAYSSDGLYWIRSGDRPVVSPIGNTKRQESKGICNARVIQTSSGYVMVHSSSDISNNEVAIGKADSADGMSWKIERTAGLNLQITPLSNTDLEMGYSVIPKMSGEKIIYGIWASIRNEVGDYGINYYELDSERKKALSSYFTGPTVGYAPLTGHYVYQSTKADFMCVDGYDEVWHWNFGDGEASEGELLVQVDHTYHIPGIYLLSVHVTCDGMYAEGEEHMIYVNAQNDYNPCGGSEEIHVDKCTGYAPFSFKAWIEQNEMDGCLNRGTDSYWVWNFGDSTIEDDLDLWTVTHTYKKPGIYTITATGYCEYVTKMFVDTQIIEVKDINSDTTACFTIEAESAFSDSTINFNTSCSQVQGIATIVSFFWDFGDGQSDSSINPSINHIYSNPGRYTVILQITVSTGKIYTFEKIITIKGLFAPSGITLERQINKSLFSAKAKNVLKWSPNPQIFECTVAQYKIYRKLSSQPDSDYQLIATLDSSTFTYTDTNIELNSKYSYVLTAVETGGHESPFSNPVENRN